MPPTAYSRVYFLGILGSFMSSLAIISARTGITVGGSDKAAESQGTALHDTIKVYAGHSPANLAEFSPDLVVYSMAISEDNPELLYAHSVGIPTLTRAQYAALLIDRYPLNIAVAGSHGKSTVTAMIYSALTDAGIDAGVISGAKTAKGSSFAIGSEAIVYEACEYKNSFLSFRPDIAVVNNLELDHTDFFRSLADIKNSFLIFINSAKRLAILNADDANLSSLIPWITARVLTVGRSPDADFRYERCHSADGRYRLRVYRRDLLICDIAPILSGEHNAFNLSVAVAVSYIMGLGCSSLLSLESFIGIERRCERICRIYNTDIIYDYAHHPTEISASLSLLSEKGYKNILLIFAPHTFSRTAFFMDSLALALGDSALCAVADIFPAREAPIEGITAKTLCDRINACGGKAVCLCEFASVRELDIYKYDCVALMGAGDLEKIKREILDIKKSQNGEDK